MQPIFNELINLWKSQAVDLQLVEGVYWLDKQIVKAFDKNGKIHNLYHIIVNDDLSVSYKQCAKTVDFQDNIFETWEETTQRIKPVFCIWFYCYSDSSSIEFVL